MRVVMLGWEYPPHISGGLGTACEGITHGLSRQGIDIIFVVPYLYGNEKADHITLIDSFGLSPGEISGAPGTGSIGEKRSFGKRVGRITRKNVPVHLKPYLTPHTFKDYIASIQRLADEGAESLASTADREYLQSESFISYGWDIFTEVTRYATYVASLLRDEAFDIIHAHDWMTFPAGLALSRLTGKPLMVHVHSLEYDRSGTQVNHQIHEIERMGLQDARAIIAVSYYTRAVINQQHGIALDKISVVHNGVYPQEALRAYRHRTGWPSFGPEHRPARMVLFLGRITFQKGPDYFVEAAARVLPHVPDALFVMAGSGDMMPRMVQRVHELGIQDHFRFPGFLKGQEVEEMFSLADLYVMPSVSEPFGISALEAIKFETPVIISRQSGVAEVLSHAFKVDFWDIDRLADLIINALLSAELREDMVSMAREELRRLHWDSAALKTTEIYRRLL